MKPDQINRLSDIVTSKRWENFDYNAHPNKTARAALDDMMAGVSSGEVDLILDLLDDYLIIKEYVRPARNLMQAIYDAYSEKNVLITPVRDFLSSRTKSGQSLHYDMSTFASLFGGGKVHFYDDPRCPKSQDEGIIHVGVDDFIGTGGQFSTMTADIVAAGLRNTISVVATICIQDEAREMLIGQGYTVISLNTRPKALSELARRHGIALGDVCRRYDNLEAQLDCPADKQRGHGRSEALVTMKATPNNTLPVFWFEGHKKWPAPFPRPKR